jgi:hypothetical protein
MTWGLVGTARAVGGEWREVLWGSVRRCVKYCHIWAAGFHRVTACSSLAGVLQFMRRLVL